MDINNIKISSLIFSAGAIILMIILGSYGLLNSQQGSEMPCMSIEFDNGQTVYNGTEQWFYQVEEGQICELGIGVLRESGSISISVFRTDDPLQYSYRGTDLPTSNFVVTLSDPGEYKVWVEAEKFAGSYCLEWMPQEEENIS